MTGRGGGRGRDLTTFSSAELHLSACVAPLHPEDEPEEPRIKGSVGGGGGGGGGDASIGKPASCRARFICQCRSNMIADDAVDELVVARAPGGPAAA